MNPTTTITDLQERLDGYATAKTKTWWERYLKGVIPFRGVKMADTRRAVHAWYAAHALETLSAEIQRDLALTLLRQPHTEDKLAGVLLLQEKLIPNGLIDWRRDLPLLAALFQEEYIYDWNTCDWFCVKVLGPLAQREGEACARAIAAWKSAETIWQRRAAGVAFVNLAAQGDSNFPGFSAMLLDVCAATVRHSERFAQTGTGWVLRELSVAEPETVLAFIKAHLPLLSAEGLRYASAKLPQAQQVALKQHHKP